MAVKVFISYSWSSPDHEEWVLTLATDLRESGFDVILDKWDLKEGNEATAFMEKMVSDPDVSKVIIVSDKVYSEKSNSRKGGAGTEAQIISSKIFEQQEQSKFVAVVRELKSSGEPYLPSYYASRIFIDFSDESHFAERFEQLSRWIADKPIHKKPELGKLPAYLEDNGTAVTLSTGAANRRAIDALVNGKQHAYPATKEYLQLFTQQLESFRLETGFDPLSDVVNTNISSFIPYRNEILEVFRAISNYSSENRYLELVHSFFERFLSYYESLEYKTPERDFDYDNFRFFGHELFLCSLTQFLSENRIDIFNKLLDQKYFNAREAELGQDPLIPFTAFRVNLKLFDIINEQNDPKRISIPADMIKVRAASSGLTFESIMQTDFLLFLRSQIVGLGYYGWWPETLVYVGHHRRAFEIFQRAQSKKYFESIKPIMGVNSKDELGDLMNLFKKEPDLLPRYDLRRISPIQLIGLDNLCKTP